MGKSSLKTNFASKARTLIEDSSLIKLARTTSIVLMGNTGSSLLNFISFTVMANRLGPKVLALFVLTQNYVLIVNAIFKIQTWESLVKFGHSETSKKDFNNVVKVNFLLDLASAMVAFIFAIAMAKPAASFFKWDTGIRDLIILYSFAIPFTLTSFTIGVPRLFDKFSAVAKIQVSTAALKLIMVLAAVFLNSPVTHYVTIYLISEVLSSILLIAYSFYLLKIRCHGEWLKSKMRYYPQQVKFVWWTNLRSIMRIPVQYSDMVIISMIMPVETVGVYKVYKEIASFIGRVGEPVNQVIYPEYAKLIGKDGDAAAINLAKKTIFVLFALSFILTTFLILCSNLLVGRLYGTDFLPLINVLYILLGLYGISLFTLPINSLFIAAGFAKIGFYIVVLTNIIYLFNAFYFGKFIGVYGIVVAFGVQMFLNQGLKFIFLKKYRTGWRDTIR